MIFLTGAGIFDRMGKSELADRLKALGVSQRDFAARIGVSAQAVNDGFKKDAHRYRAWVEALEIMTPEQRREWVATSDE